MKVYFDSSTLASLNTAEDRRETLSASADLFWNISTRSTEGGFNPISWVMCPNTFNPTDIANSDYPLIYPGASDRLPTEQRRTAKKFRRWFYKTFRTDKGETSALDASRREGTLACGVDHTTMSAQSPVIGQHPMPEALLVTRKTHLLDDAVCRVFYCHCPRNKANAAQPGFVRDNHGGKHFKVTQAAARTDDWIGRTARGEAAQFDPNKLQYGTARYGEIERKALIDAMKSGKYSEAAMNGHVADVGDIIGASEGRLTSKVHLYPET